MSSLSRAGSGRSSRRSCARRRSTSIRRWPGSQPVGALLCLTPSRLDGCDGELARLRFLESRRGAILDFWGDNLVHVAVFGCIAVGWALVTGAAWPLALGAVTIASGLGA